MTLLDSAVIAGFLKRDDALHSPAVAVVRSAAGDGPLVASVVTLAELLAGARLGHHDVEVVRGFFRDLVSTVAAFTPSLAERAADLRAAHRALRLPDAIVLATGEAHADRIVTADRRWRTVGGLAASVELVG